MKRLALSTLVLSVACGGAPTPRPVAPKPPAPVPVVAPVDPDAWRNGRPAEGALADHEYPPVETSKLANGLSLYVVRKPAGVVSMSLVAKSGSSRLPPGKSGLAAFTARMMTEGTKKHDALGLAEAVESIGTGLEESAGRDFVRLGTTTLREDLHSGLALLSEVAREPAFAPKEIERVRHEWLDSIEAERQSPGRLSALVGLRLLLGTTVGAPVNGSRHDISGLKRTDLTKFYGETFVPGNVALVVVGDVALSDVQPVAEQLFGSWRGAAPKAVVPKTETAPPAGNKIFFVDRPGAVQSALFIGQPFPNRAAPGHEDRELLNTLLGGIFTSRLNMNLREDHAYTYGANSLDIETRDWGAFAVMTSVRTDVTGNALSEAISEVKKARDASLGRPITEAEVALARVDLKQRLGATLSNTDEVAGRIEDLFIDGLEPDYFRKYPALLDSATPATVAVEAQRLDPDHAVIVVVGDRAAVQTELAKQSLPVEVVPDALTD